MSDHESTDPTPKQVVTLELLSRWENAAEDGSVKAIRKLLLAFRVGSHLGDTASPDEGEEKSSIPMRITSSDVFNELMLLCLKRVPEFLDSKLEYTPPSLDSKNLPVGKVVLPDSSKHWKSLKKLVGFYLLNVLHFLEHTTDPTVRQFVIRQCKLLVPYIAATPRVQQPFLKRLVSLWSSGSEAERVHSFMVLFRMAVITPYPFLDAVLKSVTLAYVNTCKFTSIQTMPTIRFMQNSVVELYALDFVAAYQHAFIYIRQLAIHLRNALSTHKTKEGAREVYNWMYINSLGLWTRLLVAYPGQPDLAHLIYPLTQLQLGVAQLIPTPKWYPLRFHCVKMLNLLAKSSSTYIPTAPLLLDVLNHPDFSKKRKSSSLKPIDFSCVLKVPDAALHTGVYMDGVFEQVVSLLLESLQVYSTSVAFPEMVVPIVVGLKQFRKRNKVASQCKTVGELLTRIHESADIVQDKRREEDTPLMELSSRMALFSPHDGDRRGVFRATRAVAKREPKVENNRPAKKRKTRRGGKKSVKNNAKSVQAKTEDVVEDFVLEEEEESSE